MQRRLVGTIILVGVLCMTGACAQSGRLLRGDGFTLKISSDGAMEVERNGERFRIESSYSYPGARIGYNKLGQAELEKRLGREVAPKFVPARGA